MSGKRAKSKRRRLQNERLEDRVMLTCNSGVGDFDMDGDLDHSDVDALIGEMLAGTNSPEFDLTGDQLVDRNDLDDWVLNRKGTLIGDANLDFIVDVSDFGLWNANKFSATGTWLAADFNGDGSTDVGDFNVWNANKFTEADGSISGVTLGLANDTGASSADGITSDISVCGEYGADQSPIVSVQLSLLGSDQVIDLPATDSGSFTFNQSQLENTFGQLDDGGYIFQLEVLDSAGVTRSELLDVNFDTVATGDVVGPDFGLKGQMASLEVVFGEQVDETAIDPARYALRKVGGPGDGQVVTVDSVEDIDGRLVRLNFATPLEDSQSYRLTLAAGVNDLAGNELGGFEYNFTINESFALEEVVPQDGAQAIALTQNVEIRLQEQVDPATINADSVKLISLGEEASGRFSVNAAGDTVYFFADSPWKASAEVRVQIDGNLVRTVDGTRLDADADGFEGGVGNFDFTTVSVSRVPGTMVVGRIVASQPDQNGNDVPLEGVTVRVDGFPELAVTTNHNGEFMLTDVPAPGFFVHLDGSTVTKQAGQPVPDGGFYPNVAKEFDSVPGQRTAIPFNLHLPFVLDEAISDVMPNQEVTVTLPDVQTQSDPELEMVSLTVPANSLMNEDGSAGSQVGIFRVDSDRLPAPLPNNLDHSFDITVQADAPIFDQPAEITFPNMDGLAPGEKTLLMSFDHARAEWIVVGSMTVSADGQTMTSDPDSGVRAPGWHGVQNGTSVEGTIKGIKPELRSQLDSAFNQSPDPNTAGGLLADVSNVGARAFTEGGPVFQDLPERDIFMQETVHVLQQGGGGVSEGELPAEQMQSIRDAFENATGTTNSLNEQTQRLNEATQMLRMQQNTMRQQQQTLQNVINNVQAGSGDFDQIVDRGLLWADNFTKIIDGIRAVNEAFESVGFQSTSDPVVIDQVADGIALIRDGWSHFEGVGVRESLEGIAQSYNVWLAQFDQANARLFQNGVELPYLITDVDGNFVTRGVSDADGTFNVVLPANEIFQISVADPLLGWSTTQTIGTRANGTRQNHTALLMPTDSNDMDMDGLSDTVEDVLGTNRNNPDSDGDGINDGGEVRQGLNPLDARGFPTGIISSLPLAGSASDVVTASNPNDAEDILAYVATGSAGLSIMDISQFDDPIQLGEIDLAGVNQGVTVNADRTLAAVAGGNGGLHLVDISDPMMPELVRTESLGGSVTNVEVNNGLIYAAVGSSLYAIDLVSGEQIEMVDVGANITDVSRDGNMLFTMDSSKKLTAIDISAFTMIQRGSLVLPNGGGKLFVGGGIAYASNPVQLPGGFSTVDVSDPAALALIGDVDIPPGVDSVEGPIAANGSGLAVQGGFIFGVGSSLNVFDVSDPTSTNEFRTQYQLPRLPTSLSIAGGIAIVGDGTAGVQVVNYLPFDSAEVAPVVGVQTGFNDVDGGVPGIQVVEGTSLPFNLDVTDDVQVRSVELLVDGIPFASDITFPFELTTPALSATGQSQLMTQIRVTDVGGNFTLSDPISVDIVPDTVAPNVLQLDPENGAVRSRLQRNFRITFDEPMNVNSLNVNSFQMFDPNGDLIEPELIQVGFNDTSVTLSYPELIEGTHQFRLNESMIMDRAGNALGNGTTVSEFESVTSTGFWIGGSGNFNDPANWSNGVVPGPADDALISVAGDQVITVNAVHTLLGLRSFERFNIIGGDLQVTGEGKLFAGVDISAGNVGGSAPMEIYGDSTFAGGNIVGAGGVMNRGELDVSGAQPFVRGLLSNEGTIVTNASNFYLLNGTIQNSADAVFEIQSGNVSRWSGANAFFNDGTVLKTTDSTSTFGEWLAQQGGTIEVDEGTLNLNGGGSQLDGNYQVADGASLNFNSGFTVSGDTVGTGDGAINLNNIWTIPEFDAAVLDFEPGLLRWFGSINVDGEASNVNFLQPMGSQPFLRGPGTLTNDGQIVSTANNFYMIEDAVLQNPADGVFEIAAGNFSLWSGTSWINNEGLIRKIGDYEASFNIYLIQTGGIVEVLEGSLNMTRSGEQTSGLFSVGNDTSLNFNSGFQFIGDVIGTGDGTINLNNWWNIPENETATFNFPEGMLQWFGNINIEGSATNVNYLQPMGVQAFLRGPGTLKNDGQIVSTANNFYLIEDAVLANPEAGVFEIAAGNFQLWSGTSWIDNQGLIRKTGDHAATFSIYLVQSGGTLDIREGTVNLTSGGEQTSGLFEVAADTSLNFNSGFQFIGDVIGTGAGTINLNNWWNVPENETATFNFPESMLQWFGNINIEGSATNLNYLQPMGSQPFLRGPGTLTNDGQIVSTASNFYLIEDAVLANPETGVFEIAAGNFQLWSGTSWINNQGLIRKTGDHAATFSIYLVQSGGTLGIQEGTVNLTRGGEHTAGTYNVATDTNLSFSNSDFRFTGDVVGTGAGTINLNNWWRVPVDGTASFDFPQGMVQWSGSIQIDGSATNVGYLHPTGSQPFLRGPGMLTNEGQILASANNWYMISESILENAATGTIEIASGTLNLWSGSSSVVNQGTIRVPSDASAGIGVFLSNSGRIELMEGGLLNVTRGATLENGSEIYSQIAGAAAEDYGRFSINSAINLNGSLAVDTANGFTPMPGDTFRVVSYSSATNDFATFDNNGTGLGYAVNGTGVDVGLGLIPPGSNLDSEEMSDEEVAEEGRLQQVLEAVFADFGE